MKKFYLDKSFSLVTIPVIASNMINIIAGGSKPG